MDGFLPGALASAPAMGALASAPALGALASSPALGAPASSPACRPVVVGRNKRSWRSVSGVPGLIMTFVSMTRRRSVIFKECLEFLFSQATLFSFFSHSVHQIEKPL